MRVLILFILTTNLYAKDIYYKIKGSPQFPPCIFQWYENPSKKMFRTSENCTEAKIEQSLKVIFRDDDLNLIEY